MDSKNRVEDQGLPRYDHRPAPVQHPAGMIKPWNVERALENLRRHDWARRALEKMREQARFWLDGDEEQVAEWITAEDAWWHCFCPACATPMDFAWKEGLLDDGRSIRCSKCRTVFPNAEFPEDHLYEVETARGEKKTFRCHLGKDQVTSAGENFGPRYHLSGAVNCAKQRKLALVFPMAVVYALTGEREYALGVRRVLLRFASVYPGYSLKFRPQTYVWPREHYMAGKLRGWKWHEAMVLPDLLNAYDLTAGSGVYSAEDRTAIENGICREYQWLITAHSPSRDSCLNAVPGHMLTAATCAAILGSHELMDWVLRGDEGLEGFLRRHYSRDGFWYEVSPSYANMASYRLAPLALVLQGYADPASHEGTDRYDGIDVRTRFPELRALLTAMAPATLPTGCLPAVNDSVCAARQSLANAEIANALFPDAESRRLLSWLNSRDESDRCSPLTLFVRDPLFAPEESPESPEALERSVLLPGARWAILRRPESASRSALLLNYGGDVGGHSHNSSLHFIYCDHGREVVSDLGYLHWLHPNRLWMNSSLAHNLVLVDGRRQDDSRRPVPRLFAVGGRILAARAGAPSCYPGVTDVYERTVFDIPLPGGRHYLVDFFRVRGGSEHLWSFHADGESVTPPAHVPFGKGFDAGELGGEGTGADRLRDACLARPEPGCATFEWHFDNETRTRLHYLATGTEELVLARAPGLRDVKAPHLDVPLHLLLARVPGPENVFSAVLESWQTAPQVAAVSLTPTSGNRSATAVRIDTPGGTDLVVLGDCREGTVALEEYPGFALSGRSGVLRLSAEDRPALMWVEGPGELRFGSHSLACPAPLAGTVLGVDRARRLVETDMASLPPGAPLPGRPVMVVAGEDVDVYRVESIAETGGRVTVKPAADENLRIAPGQSFFIPLTAEREFDA